MSTIIDVSALERLSEIIPKIESALERIDQEPPQTKRILYRVNEAAGLLGISPNTLKSYISARKFPFVKIEGFIGIRPEDIERVISDGFVPAIRPVQIRATSRSKATGMAGSTPA